MLFDPLCLLIALRGSLISANADYFLLCFVLLRFNIMFAKVKYVWPFGAFGEYGTQSITKILYICHFICKHAENPAAFFTSPVKVSFTAV